MLAMKTPPRIFSGMQPTGELHIGNYFGALRQWVTLILMAADILAYRANLVPVGNDQVQHLELAREICRKFNARYGEVFPAPMPRLSQTPRIMGLDGKTKMSKSRGNAIALFEAPQSIEKKLKSAFTDPDKLRKGDPGHPEICNIHTVHGAVTPPEKVREIDTNCRSGALGCGECKKLLIDGLLKELEPIRRRADELRQNPKRVTQVLTDGAARARAIAKDTLKDVRQAMGLGCPVVD